MKILFFIDVLGSGGKERRLTELMKALKNNSKCKLEIAVMSNNIHYDEVLNMGIPVHYLIRKSKKDLSIMSKFYKLCKDVKPDIVHCWDSMTAVYCFSICKILKIKFVNSMITDAPEKLGVLNIKWIRSKLTFPFSDIITGNSRAGLISYNAPPVKSFYIHNGFEFNRIQTITEKEVIREKLNIRTKYVVGMVATYSKAKDYKTFFSAANHLLQKRKDITFIAIGNNTDSISSRNHIKTEYNDFFRLLGQQSGIESYINAMDIGVLATFTEGISNSILEYMALGKPVVATIGGGTNEIVNDGETGFLTRRSDEIEFAEKIEVLLNDVSLRVQMGAAGKKRVEDYFSIEKMMNKYLEIYRIALTHSHILNSSLSASKVNRFANE